MEPVAFAEYTRVHSTKKHENASLFP